MLGVPPAPAAVPSPGTFSYLRSNDGGDRAGERAREPFEIRQARHMRNSTRSGRNSPKKGKPDCWKRPGNGALSVLLLREGTPSQIFLDHEEWYPYCSPSVVKPRTVAGTFHVSGTAPVASWEEQHPSWRNHWKWLERCESRTGP